MLCRVECDFDCAHWVYLFCLAPGFHIIFALTRLLRSFFCLASMLSFC